jgi:hypothetical protein
MAAAPAQTATLAEGGLTALPVDEDMFPDEYAGGGIVAFEEGGPTTPFGRFASEFGSNFRNKTAEELEILKLQDELRGKYGSASSLPGLFMSQTDEERQRAKDIMGRLTRMDVNELRQLTGSKNRAVPIDQLSQAQQTGTDSIDALRAKAAASRAGISNPEDRARYDENISGIKRIAENVAPKTEAKTTEAKAPEGVNVKAADKALTDYAKKVKEINKEFGVSDEPDAKTRAALEKYKEKLYYSELDTIDYSVLTDWLKWDRRKKEKTVRQENNLVFIDDIKLNKICWSIDKLNKNRITPFIINDVHNKVSRKLKKDKKGNFLQRKWRRKYR